MTHILVVDDDLTFLGHMTAALAGQGFHVLQADCGEDAQMLLKDKKFDLLVTDVVMANVSGLDLIDSAITSNMDIRILAVSGGGENDNGVQLLTEAMECGADGILQKPFPPAELIRTVHAIL